MVACEAYAIRPYTGDLKNGDFSIRSATGVAVCGAYAVAPYTSILKNGDFSIRSTIVMSSVGRMQYAPTLPEKNSSGFRFVFIR